MSEREKILEKLRKLQAHADSAKEIGSEEEAEAFAAKIQELLTAYKLSASDVRGNPVKEEPISVSHISWQLLNLKVRSIRSPWAEDLADVVARAYYCAFVIQTYPSGMIGYFVGAETDREVATHMYVILARFLEAEATRAYNAAWREYERADMDVRLLRGFRKGWIAGFVTRLKERFDEEIRPKVNATSNKDDRRGVRRNALDRVRKWMDDNLELRKAKCHRMPDGSDEGFNAGRRAADAIDLNKKAVARTASEPQRLR